ncbi:MAG: hypothetical protein U1E73_01490 [Planctomycetota bacterium]
MTIAADGSGALALAMTMREATLLDMQRVAAAAGAASSELAAIFDKESTARELSAAGLELRKHEVKKTVGKRTVTLEAAFGTFPALQQNPLAGSQAEWVLAKGPKEGTAKLTFYPQGRTAWLEARARAEAMKGEPDATAEAFFARRQKQLEGLDLTLTLNLPGDVLVWTKNMKKTGDRQVTSHVGAEDIATSEDLVRRLAPRFEVIFDATGLSLPLR